MNSTGANIKNFYPINQIAFSILIESLCYNINNSTPYKTVQPTFNAVPTPKETQSFTYNNSSETTDFSANATIYSEETTTSEYETLINNSDFIYSDSFNNYNFSVSPTQLIYDSNEKQLNNMLGKAAIAAILVVGSLLLLGILMIISRLKGNNREESDTSDIDDFSETHESNEKMQEFAL